MTVFDTTVEFRIFDAMRSPMPLEECFQIDECVQPSLDVSALMKLPVFEEEVKQHPSSSEVKEKANVSNNMVDENKEKMEEEKKKKKNRKKNKKKKRNKKKKKQAWPSIPYTMKTILNDFKTCFGGGKHSESSSPENGKKVCFAPP